LRRFYYIYIDLYIDFLCRDCVSRSKRWWRSGRRRWLSVKFLSWK